MHFRHRQTDWHHGIKTTTDFACTGWSKNGLVLRVDYFAMVSGRKAYDSQKFKKFCLENLHVLVFTDILPSLQ